VLQENEALRQRVELLQLQNEQETEELKANAVQAKEELCRYVHLYQSSEVKLLCSLERKIVNMELRHEHREKELQQVS
ncbi:hypothetical protein XENOCAPTIV_003037, partial [Xenoophorus captivus]